MSEPQCPTCGARVAVVSDREGTSHFEPAKDRLAEIEGRYLYSVLTATHVKDTSWLIAEVKRLRRIETAAEAEVAGDRVALGPFALLADECDTTCPGLDFTAISMRVADLRCAREALHKPLAAVERWTKMEIAIRELSKYAEEEVDSWDGENADRYWEARRFKYRIADLAAALDGTEWEGAGG